MSFLFRLDLLTDHELAEFMGRTAAVKSLAKRGMLHKVQGMQTQLDQYLPVLMVLLMALLATGGMIVFSILLGKRAGRSKVKDTAYECGMPPIGSGTPRMSVKFFLVAMLFILFDIEVVFLYPWAVVYREMLAQHVTSIFWAMISFMGILIVGYIYAVKKRAFDWKN